MLSTFDKPDNQSLIFNIALFISAVLIVNGLIFGLGWDAQTDSSSARTVWFEPAGYVVGIVWIGLFVLMAIARWLLNFRKSKESSRAKVWIAVLMISCLLYPFYALATGSVLAGLLGNIETIILTVFVVSQVWRISKTAALLVAPIIIWVVFATFITLAELNLI